MSELFSLPMSAHDNDGEMSLADKEYYLASFEDTMTYEDGHGLARAEYAAIAINAYDTNQARIAHYEKVVCSMCDGHGVVGNILDSMDCPECTQAANKDQARIAELEAQVETFHEFFSLVDVAENVIKKTPAQCLIESNIKAIEEFNKWCHKNMGMACSADGYIAELRKNKGHK